MPKINVEPSSTWQKLETDSLPKCIVTLKQIPEPNTKQRHLTPPAAVHVEGTRHQSTHRLPLQPGGRSVSADFLPNTEHPKGRNPKTAFTCHQSHSIFYVHATAFYSLILESQRTVSTCQRWCVSARDLVSHPVTCQAFQALLFDFWVRSSVERPHSFHQITDLKALKSDDCHAHAT